MVFLLPGFKQNLKDGTSISRQLACISLKDVVESEVPVPSDLFCLFEKTKAVNKGSVSRLLVFSVLVKPVDAVLVGFPFEDGIDWNAVYELHIEEAE
jgi:hypothetical protein